jgi:hypothetical protein
MGARGEGGDGGGHPIDPSAWGVHMFVPTQCGVRTSVFLGLVASAFNGVWWAGCYVYYSSPS